ncbi:MAG: GTPase [Candidatus Kapaibacterium sp.]
MKQTLKAGFLKGAAAKADFPDSPFPEIAFVGRSNVGKSSLLNFVVT